MNKMNVKKLLIAVVSTMMISSSAVFADGHKYSVTSDNMAEYSSMLTPGMMNMFSAYPDTFRMDVYANGGECTMDPDVAAISQSNGTMINDNEGIEVPNMGQVPFPDPSHPQHYVWNYRMYAGTVRAVERVQTSVNVKADGSIVRGQQETQISFPTNPRTKTMYADTNLFALFMQKNLGPPRTAGTVTLVHDFIDSYLQPRKAWQYSPATRRVRRAPDITYDTLTTAGGGITTVDSYGGFNGAQDKYDWSYEGKQTMIVPMNNDMLANTGVEDVFTPNHPNPDYVRFEERDVHVVHAQLKPGQRHLYASRTFYFLDGQPGLLVYHDAYDDNQDLMRANYQTTVAGNMGGSGLGDTQCNVQGEYTMDFATRAYVGTNLFGPALSPRPSIYNGEEKAVSFYTPDGLRRYAR
jgi:flagellar basal body rod protein FlgC